MNEILTKKAWKDIMSARNYPTKNELIKFLNRINEIDIITGKEMFKDISVNRPRDRFNVEI